MSNVTPTWLDKLLNKLIAVGGVQQPPRGTVDFASGVTVTDDPGNDTLHINVQGTAVAGGQFNTTIANGANHNVPTNQQGFITLGGNTAAASIDGFVAPVGAVGGERRIITNTTAFPITLSHLGSGSTSGNRVFIPFLTDVILPPRSALWAITYDTSVSPNRWVLEHIGAQASRGLTVKDLGAWGDGVHDDTTAVQNAITAALTGGGVLGNSLFFPAGTYLISSQLTTGTGGQVRITGEHGGQTCGAQLKWTGGAFAGAVLKLHNLNASLIDHLHVICSVDGLVGAKYGIQSDTDVPSGSSEDTVIDHCAVLWPIGTGSAGFVLGDAAADNVDLADVVWRDCTVVGSVNGGVAHTDYGWLLQGSDNTKNYLLIRPIVRSAKKSNVRMKGDPLGSVVVIHPVFGASFSPQTGIVADFHCDSSRAFLNVVGGESENSARFVYCDQSTTAPGNAIFTGYVWSGTAFDNHTDSESPKAFADVAGIWNGNLTLTGCDLLLFADTSLTTTNPPNVIVNVAPRTPGIAVNSQLSSFTSIQTTYFNAKFLPLYDASPGQGGNLLVEWHDYAHQGSFAIISRGDTGGVPGATIPFPAYEGGDIRCARQQLWPQLSSAQGGIVGNFAKLNAGILATSIAKVTMTHTDWAALTVGQPFATLFRMPNKTRILSVIMDHTVAYSWTTAPLTDTIAIEVGVTHSGSEYLLAHDVKAAPPNRQGEVTGDLGSLLAPGANNSFGSIFSWTTGPTSGDPIYATLVAGGGHTVSDLATGSTDFYFVFQVIP